MLEVTITMEKTITIPAGETKLAAIYHTNEENDKGKRPLIIICHGFVGSKTGVNRLFVKAAREFAKDGFNVLRFDYAGCGESEGDYGTGGFDHLLEQTQHVLDFAFGLEGIDPNRVILVGHSLGGAVALLSAIRDTRIHKLVMWAAVGHPFQDIVRIVGETEYSNSFYLPYIDHEGFALTNRFFRSLAGYKPLEEVQNYTGDVLLVHGTNDEAIPAKYSFLYHSAFKLRKRGRSDKEIIFGADHTFSSIDGVNQLIHHTRRWLAAVLKQQQPTVFEREHEYQTPLFGCM
ncbi:alpha/beta hydrolase [Brevibacillus fluminis]|uniref:alpha/beta hydrolase n=1 Tax=Brevibacillus fluminis TaxID=511487 RepID=UPI003F8CBC75